MKVFVLIEYFAEDYSTGGGTVEGLYSTFDKAFAKVLERNPKAKPERNFALVVSNGTSKAILRPCHR